MDFIKVKVVGVTEPVVDNIPDSEGIVSYCARVSAPQNQTNFDTAAKLLKYCVKNQHWSVFETVNIVMEIECPRDIARQVLRHRSFSFQEFSQRYAKSTDFIIRECRMQDNKNRQNSLQTEDEDLKCWWEMEQDAFLNQVEKLYKEALEKGIAKEVARVILPEGLTMSRMYMNGTLRSWMHYIDVRADKSTQLEHQDVAVKAREELMKYFPFLEEFYQEE